MKLSLDSLIHGDCFAGMCNIPDKSIDLICTDPPYGISFEDNTWDKNIPDWSKLFLEFDRIIKPNGNIIIFKRAYF